MPPVGALPEETRRRFAPAPEWPQTLWLCDGREDVADPGNSRGVSLYRRQRCSRQATSSSSSLAAETVSSRRRRCQRANSWLGLYAANIVGSMLATLNGL